MISSTSCKSALRPDSYLCLNLVLLLEIYKPSSCSFDGVMKFWQLEAHRQLNSIAIAGRPKEPKVSTSALLDIPLSTILRYTSLINCMDQVHSRGAAAIGRTSYTTSKPGNSD